MTRTDGGALTTVRLKLAFGTFLAVFALSLVNEVFGLRLTGDYDWEAVLAVIAVGSVAMAFSVGSALRR